MAPALRRAKRTAFHRSRVASPMHAPSAPKEASLCASSSLGQAHHRSNVYQWQVTCSGQFYSAKECMIQCTSFKSSSSASARWSRSSPSMVSCSMPYVSVNLSTPPSYLDSTIQSFLHSLQPPILQLARAPHPLDLQWLPLHSLTPIQTLLAIPVGIHQTSQVSPMLHCPSSHTHCSCSSAHSKVRWGQSQAHQEECTQGRWWQKGMRDVWACSF